MDRPLQYNNLMSSQSLQDLLDQYQVKDDTNKYISQEFQDYAYRLAMDLSNPEDRETISLCMRLVKTRPRALVEAAHRYVLDAAARNKVALFLWKLKQLENEVAAKKTEGADDDKPGDSNGGEQPSLLET